jgi:hypothetical protein
MKSIEDVNNKIQSVVKLPGFSITSHSWLIPGARPIKYSAPPAARRQHGWLGGRTSGWWDRSRSRV